MMEMFPFTPADWITVQAASHAVLNATLADDDVLAESYFNNLMMVLNELCGKYGEHPVLIETEADFADDPVQQVIRYRCALRLAEAHQLPTLSIRLSLARVLLEHFGDSSVARNELMACQHEMAENVDRSTKSEWSELLAQCGESP